MNLKRTRRSDLDEIKWPFLTCLGKTFALIHEDCIQTDVR